MKKTLRKITRWFLGEPDRILISLNYKQFICLTGIIQRHINQNTDDVLKPQFLEFLALQFVPDNVFDNGGSLYETFSLDAVEWLLEAVHKAVGNIDNELLQQTLTLSKAWEINALLNTAILNHYKYYAGQSADTRKHQPDKHLG